MDFKKFNESISNLIINSESNFGFVTNEVANPFHKDMKLIAEKLKQTIDDCLKICLEQNIIASDNVKFGEYLSEMSKQMWIHILADQKKPTPQAQLDIDWRKHGTTLSANSPDSIQWLPLQQQQRQPFFRDDPGRNSKSEASRVARKGRPPTPAEA